MNNTNTIEWLEKLAVDTEVLQERLSRVPGVFKMDKKDIQRMGSPGFALQRKEQMKENLRRSVGESMGATAISDYVSEYERTLRDSDKKLSDIRLGAIGIPGPKKLSAAWPSAPPETAEGRKALRSLTLAHEVAERGTHPTSSIPAVQSLVGHHNLNVLVKDHNLANNLTGHGSEEASKAMLAARDRPMLQELIRTRKGKLRPDGAALTETHLLRRTVDNAFGHDGAAQQFIGPGQKMNRSMRKAFQRILDKRNGEPLAQALLSPSLGGETPTLKKAVKVLLKARA